MNFERGKDTKHTLKIGGVDIQKRYDETVGLWKDYMQSFEGQKVKFKVDRYSYSNWDDRIEIGELVEIKTMIVKEAYDNYSGHPGCLYFTEEGSSQCWFIDMSKPLYFVS